jgi:hypothetical protein
MNDDEYDDSEMRSEIGGLLLTESEISRGVSRRMSQTERDRSGEAEATKIANKEARLSSAYSNLAHAIDRVMKHTVNVKKEKKELLRLVIDYLKTETFEPASPPPPPSPPASRPAPPVEQPDIPEWERSLPENATVMQVANAFVGRGHRQ